ncbi:MAG: cold shock domain-containing protein [Candidatus Hermodarchaeia archaeon]|jgi:cold shock CspA family protein
MENEKLEFETGKIKWWSRPKAYGFVERDNGEPDCFLHITRVKDGTHLQANDRVEFIAKKSDRGWIATRCCFIGLDPGEDLVVEK